MPRPVHRDRIAVAYYRALTDLVRDEQFAVERHVLPQLGRWLEESAARHDAKDRTIHEAVDDAAQEVGRKWSARHAARVVQPVAEDIRGASRLHAIAQMRAAIGLDVVAAEPNLEPHVAHWVEENVRLIKTVRTRFFGEIEDQLVEGVHSGARWETLRDDLMERTGVSKTNAARIARDQVGKLFGQLNAKRMTDLGITEGVWETRGDNRTCEECESKQGRTFSLDDGLDGDLPGEVHPLCSCFFSPVLTDLFDEAQEAA